MDKTPYQEFAKAKLGFEFKDIDLLVTALTHRSYVNEHKASVHDHNERLEFLGDAILEMVSSDFLYRNYNEPEGIMTSWRAALVRTESIGAAGKELGYEPLVRLSKGEKHGSERAHDVILADCFEAVIGAIYIDSNFENTKKFINKFLSLEQTVELTDYKTSLQELVQAQFQTLPEYKVIKEYGPDHDKKFEIAVFVEGKQFGFGRGSSKKEAEQNSAKQAYRKLNK